MTVPPPRDELEAGGTLLSYVAQSVRQLGDDVKQGFRDVQQQLTALPENYVSRREFDRYRDEREVDFAEATRRHEADVKDLKDAAKALAEDAKDRATQARTFRMWLLGLGATVGLGIGADLIAILHH